MAAAHVPDGTTFATKPALAVGMIERAIAAGLPFAWVAADSVYAAMSRWSCTASKGYVLGVNPRHLTLMREDAAQREHSLRELSNGLRYVIRYEISWRAMPNDLPPWFTVYQQAQRWLAAGCFDVDFRSELTRAERNFH
jgi:hypothetical protein